MLIALVLLASCTTNPYSTVVPRERTPAPANAAGQRLDDAMDYLHALRADYRAKRSADFERQQNLATGLFGLGAVAVGLAAYGAHPDATGGVALTGATAYQIGKWNTDAGRNVLYAEGIAALTCAESVMTPVVVAARRYDAVTGALSAVRDRQDDAARARAAAVSMLTTTTLTSSVRAAYEPVVADADREMRRAVRAIGRAQEWTARVDRGGSDLNGQVEQVRNAVDSALAGRLPDLANLMDAVGALGGYATFFGGAATERGAAATTPSGVTPKETTTQSNQVAVTLPGYRQIAALILATERLALSVQALADAQPKLETGTEQTRLAGCAIDMATLPGAVQVDPVAIEAAAHEAAEQTVEIKGPDGLYRTTVASATAGLTVTQPQNRIFTVSIGATVPAGTYVVRVDGERKSFANLTVHVLPGAASVAAASVARVPSASSTTRASGATTGAPDLRCSADGRTQAEVCLAQQYLQVKTDANFGKASCDAFLAQDAKGLLNDTWMIRIQREAGLAPDATDAQVRAVVRTPCPDRPPAGLAAASGSTPPAKQGTPIKANGAGAGLKTGAPGASATGAVATSCPPVTSGCQVKGARCDLECRMRPNEFDKLREKLGLLPTQTEFDQTFREALARKQKLLGITPQTGEYDTFTAQQLNR